MLKLLRCLSRIPRIVGSEGWFSLGFYPGFVFVQGDFLRIDSKNGINHHEDFTTTFFGQVNPVFGSHFSLLHPNIKCSHRESNGCIFWDQVRILCGGKENLHPKVKGKSLLFFRTAFFKTFAPMGSFPNFRS